MKYTFIFDLPNKDAEEMRELLLNIFDREDFQHVFVDDGRSFNIINEGICFVCAHSMPGMIGVECFPADEIPAACIPLTTYCVYDDSVYKVVLTNEFSIEEQGKKAYVKTWDMIHGNFDAVKARKQKCGCIGCCSVYDSDIITKDMTTQEPDGSKSVVCPFCGSAAVIYEDGGLPVTEEFLIAMQRYA